MSTTRHRTDSSDNFDLGNPPPSVGDVPRLGVGSSNCAGNEKRTAAMSATPMNLWKADQPWPCRIGLPLSRRECEQTGHRGSMSETSYLRRMFTSVFSLELSSCGFSETAMVGGVDDDSTDMMDADDGAGARGNVVRLSGV